ncbi:hypothetical protein MMC17_009269 [Xylographa soralifera]|nr:hypothetical protein [Xylographa soralifera]
MTTNIVILGLPQSTLVGIDLLCFASSPHFQGIAAIPPGWHFLFTSPTIALSIRHGTWFFISSVSNSQGRLITARRHTTKPTSTQSSILVFEWSDAKEQLMPLVDEAALSLWSHLLELNNEDGESLRRGLFPYRQTVTKELTSQINKNAVDLAEESLEGSTDWPLLTAHLSHELLERVTNPMNSSPLSGDTGLSTVSMSVLSPAQSHPSSSTAYYTLTTSSTSPEDRDDIPGLSAEDARNGIFGHEEKALDFLGINLKKTWRHGAVGRERTEGARDRSWALRDIINGSQQTKPEHRSQNRKDASLDALQGKDFHGGLLFSRSKERLWGNAVLGEMEFCFLGVLTLSNYSCLEQWKRILSLVLTSYQIIASQSSFFVTFLDLLLCQLQHCDDVEGGMFEVGRESGSGEENLLRQLLIGFKKELQEMEGAAPLEHCKTNGDIAAVGLAEVKEKMQEVEMWLREEWRWELSDSWVRRGMIELEDGERVEVEVAEMEGEDERGEYAPVVVEM